MKKIDAFLEAAEEKNLKKMGLAGASNGYPEPDLGWFICEFNTYEDAELFAKENGGIVAVSEWRDGWGYAHYLGEAVSALEVDENWYGDGYRIIDSPFKNFAEYMGYDEKEDPCKDFEDEEIEKKKKEYEELKSEVGAYVDWESQNCILDENRFFDTIAKDGREMKFSHDTENKAVGVAYLWSETEEGE